MKLFFVPILALVAALPVLALPEPVAAPVPVEFEKRDTACVVKFNGLNCRTCPRTSCPVAGRYPVGTRITVKCYTETNTTAVNGDRFVTISPDKALTEITQ